MEIEGSKINLRDWVSEDIQIFKQWLEPKQEWQKLDAPYFPITKEVAEQRVVAAKRDLEKNNFFLPRTRLVIADKNSNKLIGTVNCYWESIETNWLSAGIAIYDPNFWGKGVGFESMTLWIDYIFETYKDIVRLDFRTWSGNSGMMNLAKKLGFQQEACFRNARIVEGNYYDGLAFGVLKSEWISKSRPNLI